MLARRSVGAPINKREGPGGAFARVLAAILARLQPEVRRLIESPDRRALRVLDELPAALDESAARVVVAGDAARRVRDKMP